MKTRILLLSNEMDPLPFVNKDTLILRKVSQQSATFYNRDHVEYYSESKNCYRWGLGELEKLPFPAKGGPGVLIKDQPLFIGHVVNRTGEYQLWTASEKSSKTNEHDTVKMSFVTNHDQFIQIDITQRFTGVSCGIIFNTTEYLSINIVSDNEMMMDSFKKLIDAADHHFNCYKNDKLMQVGENLFKKIPQFEFTFSQNFMNGGSGWSEKKLNSIRYLFESLEKASNLALDPGIYCAAHVRSPDLSIPDTFYALKINEELGSNERSEIYQMK